MNSPFVIYIMNYSLTTVILLVIGCYLSLSPRAAFGQAVKTNKRVRRLAGTIVLALAFSFILHAFEPNDSSERAHYIRNVFYMIDILVTNFVMLHLLLSLLQTRKYPKWLVPAIVMPTIFLTVGLIISHNAIWFKAQQVYWIFAFVVFVIFYFRESVSYTRWLRSNYASLDNIGIQWTYTILFLVLLQFVFLALRVQYPLSLASWVSNAIYIIFAIYLMLCVDHLEAIETPQVSEAEDVVELEEKDLEWIGNQLVERCEKEELYLQYDLTVDQLLRVIGTNRTYLSRYFSQHGITYYSYINKLRVEHALRLMDKSHGKLNFTLVAAESGFRSLSTFYRAFKEHMGCTPKEYVG